VRPWSRERLVRDIFFGRSRFLPLLPSSQALSGGNAVPLPMVPLSPLSNRGWSPWASPFPTTLSFFFGEQKSICSFSFYRSLSPLEICGLPRVSSNFTFPLLPPSPLDDSLHRFSAISPLPHESIRTVISSCPSRGTTMMQG